MRRLLWLLPLLTAGPAWADEPITTARPDTFKTLVNPMCSHCRDEAKRRTGELRDDDRVLCWLRGYSDGGVIPYRTCKVGGDGLHRALLNTVVLQPKHVRHAEPHAQDAGRDLLP